MRMNAEVCILKKTIVARFKEIHDGVRVIESPELELAETAAELYAALCVVFNRCPAKFPLLSVILHFRRKVRIAGELSLDGEPLNQGRL